MSLRQETPPVYHIRISHPERTSSKIVNPCTTDPESVSLLMRAIKILHQFNQEIPDEYIDKERKERRKIKHKPNHMPAAEHIDKGRKKWRTRFRDKLHKWRLGIRPKKSQNKMHPQEKLDRPQQEHEEVSHDI